MEDHLGSCHGTLWAKIVSIRRVGVQLVSQRKHDTGLLDHHTSSYPKVGLDFARDAIFGGRGGQDLSDCRERMRSV